ncbi:MAG: type II toxin-antitoxin system YafQ family toxin, partial [Opitutales bacterium]|nr:type II toxin-antitoxin system YafQ family toxin [Opitutales bacterium]
QSTTPPPLHDRGSFAGRIQKLGDVVRLLAADEPLEEKHRDHPLIGRWVGSRDCHIEPDWVLIYRNEPELLYLERSGSHSDLFKK